MFRNLIMRLFLLFLVFAASQGPAPTPSKVGKPEQQQSSTSQKQAGGDQSGTEQSPLVVKIAPSVKTPEETAGEAEDRKEKSANDRHIVYLTAALALLAFLQLLVYIYQSIKLRQTVQGATEQSKAMDRHVGEATRSANAMENVVAVINFGNHAALRAYLTVIIGSAIYQEHREDIGDLRFEAKPLIANTGNTPARKVSFKKAAAILPIPIPEEFQFPLPEEETADAGTVGAHQNYVISGLVEDLVPWEDVGTIKKGISKALCVWGIVHYEDMFGGKHYTKFGQILTWQIDGKTVMGYFIAGQNDGD
jgi:hypothetical protein